MPGRTAGATVDEFRFTFEVPVRFRDLDALGHVNHAVYFSYFEEARTAYWIQVLGIESHRGLNFIVARAECDYKAPVHFPATVRVGVRCSSIGNKSFVLEYRAVTGEGTLVALGRTTCVAYDYARGAAVLVPDEVRAALQL